MLVRIDDAHRGAFLDFLAQDPEFNTYFLGDIAQYGLRHQYFQVYAEQKRGQYVAAMFNLYGSVCFYSDIPDYNRFRFMLLLVGWTERYSISGRAGSFDRILDLLPHQTPVYYQFCKLSADRYMPYTDDSIRVRWATVADAAAWCRLRGRIAEFTTPFSLEGTRQSIAEGSWKTALVEADGKIVAAASLTSEHAQGGMIVSVMTDPEHRGKGYATACVSWICRRLIEADKFVCLFYDNPMAKSVYERLGFEDFGMWERVVF